VKTAVTLINRDKAGRDEVAGALRAAGIEGRIERAPATELAKRAADAVKAGAELVIAGGGDGTVSGIAGALAGSKTKLGILPLGTLNHFARDLGVPFDLAEAARTIAKGRARRVDLAEVNGRIFVNNAAIGLYPLMLVDRDSQRRRLGRSKRLAVLVASLRTMLHFHRQRLRLSVGGGAARVDTPLLFVGNNDYRLSIPGAGRRERIDEGELCVFVMRKKTLPGVLAATVRALIGLSRADDMVRLDEVTELRVESALPWLTLGIDGETERMATPLLFRIRPRALTVIAPDG
jgi:diacylglycerol kinase family enzyme